MYLSPRHAEILQMAKEKGRVLVDDLAVHFGVTPQTIRKDLNDLCDQRLLSRIHGGALFPSGIANLEYENVTHLLPTFHGDTLYARTEILGKKESQNKGDRGVVYVETIIYNQRDEDVLLFRRKLLVPKRAFAIRPHTHVRPN